MLGTLVAGLPAGHVADRFDRRRVLVLAEAARAVAAATIAIALAAHHLTLAHTLVVAAVLGTASPFGSTARMLLVRAVVPAEQLTAALTQEQVRNNVTQLAGPPLGGFLYGLRPMVPFLFSAITFTVSLACALIVRVPARTVEPSQARTGILTGIRTIWASPLLRAATILVAAMNTVGAPLTLVVTVILRRQGVPPTLIGVALAGFAVGGLLGAPLIRPLHRRFGPGALLIGVTLIHVPLFAAVALPWGPWWIALVMVVSGIGIPALQVLVDVLIFRQVPDEQRGRVIAAVITLFGIGIPVGTAAAGLLLQYLTGPQAVFVLAGGIALSGLYAVTRPELRTAQWPQD